MGQRGERERERDPRTAIVHNVTVLAKRYQLSEIVI